MSYRRGKPCAEKFPFPTEAEARAQLRIVKAASRENKKILNTLNVYRCHCGAWHLGHDRRNWRTRKDVA